MILEATLHISYCPCCGAEIPNEPRPSCNECECCFCSEECRDTHHQDPRYRGHDYNKPLEDL